MESDVKQSLVVYADGGCRNNPGPMGIGASIQTREGMEIDIVSEAIGHGTNNVAEYRAAIEGVKKALDHGACSIELRMDSQLVVRQVNGEYQVKHLDLRTLWNELRGLLGRFDAAVVSHVPREHNRRADELANLALDGVPSQLNDAERRLAHRIRDLVEEARLHQARTVAVLAEASRLLRTSTD